MFWSVHQPGPVAVANLALEFNFTSYLFQFAEGVCRSLPSFKCVSHLPLITIEIWTFINVDCFWMNLSIHCKIKETNYAKMDLNPILNENVSSFIFISLHVFLMCTFCSFCHSFSSLKFDSLPWQPWFAIYRSLSLLRILSIRSRINIVILLIYLLSSFL